MYICTSVCIYTHIHIYKQARAKTFAATEGFFRIVFICVCVCVYVYMYTYVHIYVYVYIFVYKYLHTQIYVYVYIRICMYMHAYILLNLLNVWHNSFICVTCLIHMWHISLSYSSATPDCSFNLILKFGIWKI